MRALTHNLNSDDPHAWNVTAFAEDEELEFDSNSEEYERILDSNYVFDSRYTAIDRLCQDFMASHNVWGGDAVCAHDGFFSLSLLWFDFHADLLKRPTFAALPDIKEARAWVLHMRRIREVLLEQTRRKLSLYQLTLFTNPDLFYEKDLHYLRRDVRSLEGLVKRCTRESTLMDFWECLGVELKVDAYSPGY